jgi:hypothetical protein
MDNKSAFFRARYKTVSPVIFPLPCSLWLVVNLPLEQAESYALAGQNAKCLDICWQLRLEPDMALCRRALVNLLIACTSDIRIHPDKAKYAQERLDPLAQLRREGLDGEDDDDICKIENHARQTLIDIEAERGHYAVQATAGTGGSDSTDRPAHALDDQVQPPNSDALLEDEGSLDCTGEDQVTALDGVLPSKDT